MPPMRKPFVALVCALAMFACGDNDHPGGGDDDPIEPDAPRPDAEVPDAMPIDAPTCDFPAGAVGGECVNDDDCDTATNTNGICYAGPKLPSVFPPEGYCSIDNGLGTVCDSDDDCGTGGLCVDSGGYRYCLPACCTDPNVEGGFCPPNQACFTSFNGFPNDRAACVPGNAQAQDGDPCAGFYECNEYSQCLADFEHPGGLCETYGAPPPAADCTVGSSDGCHGGTCIADPDPPTSTNICVDACDADADCRMAEGYRCYDPDPKSATDVKYCRATHAGDPCETAADCGGGTWVCQTTGFLGGYCTQTGCTTPGDTVEQCTQGSACHDPAVGDNYCADRCEGTAGTQGTCRTGYLCIDVDPTGTTTLACVPAP